MTTATATKTAQKVTYTIVPGGTDASRGSAAFSNEFIVSKTTTAGTEWLRTHKGDVRYFATRAGARKAITREKTGNYHF